jgi:hypothetical protein
MDDAWAYVLVTIVVVCLVLVAIMYLITKDLLWRLRHERKMPEGHFRVKVSKPDWDKAIQQGALAVAMTAPRSGKVLFTIVIERQAREGENAEAGKTP